MKVIEKGRPQEGWSTETTCTGHGNGDGGCGAKLLVEQPDLFTTSSSALHEVTTYVTFKCCECGVLTDLASGDGRTRSNVPGRFWRELPKRTEWERTRTMSMAEQLSEYLASVGHARGDAWMTPEESLEVAEELLKKWDIKKR